MIHTQTINDEICFVGLSTGLVFVGL